MDPISIDGNVIDDNSPPFVIAELSGNHQQNFELAKQMVKAAADAGVDAIKLQSYTADSLTLNVEREEFVINEQDSLWHGRTLHSLYQEAATPYEWHKALFDYARSLGLVAFSSPFDKAAVDMLSKLDVPCYKIASFENNDIPLLRYVAQQGKPVILSTGMATLGEVEEAVACIRGEGNNQIILLKCTSTYPAASTNTNLATIPHMRQSFGCLVGLSDHTQGIGASVASVALGATVIEKHFVIDRSAGGVDAAFSMEPDEMAALVRECKTAHQAIGNVVYGGTQAEADAKRYRRSIYIAQDVKQGEALSEQNLKVVRPGLGLAPRYWEEVLGRVATKDFAAGTPLDWTMVG
ncbi:pseudaminic acid synthase [Aliagarivorans marinus]|uniref:pseudaminic acid synthase n=1 Tax=Aliagarivorans marinus TaxID=561965 RepID=UPI00041C675C|nr:pseudaminic acid synthase [Aliagarivorans marinus]